MSRKKNNPPGSWPLQDAKARFSELVRRVRSDGPQHVAVRGRDEVVVVAAEEFRRLKGERTGAALTPTRAASGARCETVTGWLLDTNVLSELRRPKPSPKVVAFVASKPLDLLFVGIVTFAETRFAIERVGDRHTARGAERLADAQGAPDVRGTRPADRRRCHVQVPAAGRRRAQGRTHLFATRSDHRRHGAAAWSDGRFARHRGFQQGPCSDSQPVAREQWRITRYLENQRAELKL